MNSWSKFRKNFRSFISLTGSSVSVLTLIYCP